MEDITVREWEISFLQQEYNKYSNIIYGQMQHIEKLASEEIISMQQRLGYLNNLNYLIRYMNQDIYNQKLKELKFFSLDDDNNQIDTKNSLTKSELGQYAPESEDRDMFNLAHGLNVDTNLMLSESFIKPLNQDQDQEPDSKPEQNKVKLNQAILDKPIKEIFGQLPLNTSSSFGINAMLDLCKDFKLTNLNLLLSEDFNKVSEKIIGIGKNVGFKSIFSALDLLVGSSHQELLKDNMSGKINMQEYENRKEFREMLGLLNDTFIPIRYTELERSGSGDKSIESYGIQTTITNKPIGTNILQNEYNVIITFPNASKRFGFDGYFSLDTLQTQVRTCQIAKPFLYRKKKLLQSYLDETKSDYASNKFINIYMKNLTIGDIISYTKENFASKVSSDFELYTTYSSMSFRNLMDEFKKETPDSIKNMFTIIKLLLFGPEDCINMAGLLFGLVRDKKNNIELIGNIIYNNLSLPLQTKLRKSTQNIKNELEKLKNIPDEEISTEKIIASNPKIPLKIKKIILGKLAEIKAQGSDSAKHKTHADILARFPWEDDDNTFTNLSKDLPASCDFMDKVIGTLNDKIYGHHECKDAIKELICSWILNPNKMGKALALCGPPGVGKTLIAKALGSAIGVPVRCMSLCGMEDGSVLNGHSFTYSNAQPGLIVREMCEAGKARSILFFDEIDKTSKRHNINEIQNILINMTDANMNSKFADKFFQETTFPLDKAICIFTYNDRSSIDPILLNRFHEIEVKPYTVKDKLRICNDYLLKEIHEGIKLEHGCIKIADEDIKFVIENYTYESGVRELKRVIETLFLKLNVDRLYQRGLFACACNKDKNTRCGCRIEINKANPIQISRDMITKYLSKPKISHDKIQPYDGVGIVNGLYATQSGNGGLVSIIVQKNLTPSASGFELKLTGSQGNVMKESVQFAWTTMTNIIKEKYINKFIENTKGISIHALDGATSKDGPSAGCAFGTAFASLVLGKKIKNTIAMTGEIGIYGEAKAIGGLVSKLYGAKKAGAKLVFVPRENERDYRDIEATDTEHELFNENFKVKLVDTIYDILPDAFVDGLEIDEYLNPRPTHND